MPRTTPLCSDDLYVQAAMLFTNEAGSRRIRVHNLRLVGTENVQSVFRHADIDAILSLFIRDAASALITKPPATVANDLIAPSIDMLYSYRKNCAPNSSAGQLILPDSLKLLPCYLAALFKTDAFAVNKPAARGLVPTGVAAAAGRGMPLPGATPGGAGAAAAGGGGSGAPEPYIVRADTRIAQLLALNCIAPALLIPLVYPRLFVLHNMGGVVSDDHDHHHHHHRHRGCWGLLRYATRRRCCRPTHDRLPACLPTSLLLARSLRVSSLAARPRV